MGESGAAAIDADLARGEYLAAADRGLTLLATAPDDLGLVWRSALALARCGATSQAARVLADHAALDRAEDAPPRLAEDLLALDARLMKDRAFAATGPERAAAARAAAARYTTVADRFESHYATVNAATLALMAGDGHRARRLAELAVHRTGSDDDYWAHATRAEAHLLSGRPDAAFAALAAAAATEPDAGRRSTTVRQLRIVCALTGTDTAVLDALPVASVAHLAGHMFATGPEDRLRAEVRQVIDARGVGVVVCSLACGADLVMAEVALDLGLELRVVLPCTADQFIVRSVAPGGSRWVDRFHRARARASDVVEEPATALGDDAMFAYGDRLAMGTARIRARQLGGEVFQIAAWDGADAVGPAGTAAAVAAWRGLGGETVVIELPRADLSPVAPAVPSSPGEDARPRGIKAMLFADVVGFSTLTEEQLPAFFERVMGALAEELGAAGGALRYRNTWGDALYLVFDDALTAAATALRLQRCARRLADELGWPELALRIGGHAGPVFDGFDHVRDEPTYYGTHVTRAARIEPTTPAGEVYVTDALAALVALEPVPELRLEYVGHVPTAKGYGAFPMYLVADDAAGR